MASVREHLKSFHEKAEAHHRKLAKVHRSLSEHHTGLADLHGDGSEHGRLHKAAAESHESIADHHEEMRGFHEDCLKGLDDISTIKTAGGSGIAPDAPQVFKVTRFGQPDRPEGVENVPVELTQFVETE